MFFVSQPHLSSCGEEKGWGTWRELGVRRHAGAGPRERRRKRNRATRLAEAPLARRRLPADPPPPSFSQVVVGDDEAPEMAVKRFRRLAGNAAVVTEVRET